jgi:hypothetical protein
MNPFKLSICILLSISQLSCSHTEKNETFNKDVSMGHCENAYLHIPDNTQGLKFVRKTQEATGTALHYAATGAGYFAEYTVYLAAGVLIAVISCGPAALAGGGECIPINAFQNNFSLPTLGKNTKKSTTKWSCSNIDPLSQQVRQVASCFKSRGTADDLKAAQSTLENFRKSENIYQCLSEKERELFRMEMDAIKIKNATQN